MKHLLPFFHLSAPIHPQRPNAFAPFGNCLVYWDGYVFCLNLSVFLCMPLKAGGRLDGVRDGISFVCAVPVCCGLVCHWKRQEEVSDKERKRSSVISTMECGTIAVRLMCVVVGSVGRGCEQVSKNLIVADVRVSSAC